MAEFKASEEDPDVLEGRYVSVICSHGLGRASGGLLDARALYLSRVYTDLWEEGETLKAMRVARRIEVVDNAKMLFKQSEAMWDEPAPPPRPTMPRAATGPPTSALLGSHGGGGFGGGGGGPGGFF